MPAYLSWFGIVRLGLAQTALGAIFVLSTSTLNRVMVVELALPAVLPGTLIALHYATQVLRPALGHGSDRSGRRTPWIIGGMGAMAAGGFLAAVATALMATHLAAGIVLATIAFVMIGLGVGAGGTALLVLIAKRSAPERRPAAGTVAYVMMIMGFIMTAGVAGKMLDPFSPSRLVVVAATISSIGFLLTIVAVFGVEGAAPPAEAPTRPGSDHGFGTALRQVWADPAARRFALFMFVSMLAYGGEELMIEPFGGAIFGLTPGQTAKLSGALHGGALLGMLFVGFAATWLRRRKIGSLETWMTGGCIASAAALTALAAAGMTGRGNGVAAIIFALGFANGSYAVAAVGAMMQRVGGDAREGVRMGLWGAAQAIALGTGGLTTTIASDAARHHFAWQPAAYASVFLAQACLLLGAAVLAARLAGRPAEPLADPSFGRPA